MKQHWRLGLALCALAGGVSAADLGECVSIKDDAVRLFCYDRVAGRAPSSSANLGASAAPGAAIVAPSSPAAAPAPAAPVAAAPVAETAPEPKRIESHIVGSFDGWRQNTWFKLENGQTWESIGTVVVNVRKIESPAIVIERDFLGQLKMKVDGVSARAAVRRLDN